MDRARLKKFCNETIRPSDFLDYREYLEALYVALKSDEPEYTYFDFAFDAGLGRNNLMNALIRGRRPLTPKTCKKMIAGLGMVGRERQYFELLVEHSYVRDPVERESIFRKLVALKGALVVNDLDKWQLEFFSHWSHAVLLELMGFSDCTDDPQWFQERIRPKLTLDEVNNGLELLCRIGYARLDKSSGRYIALQSDVATGPEVASVAMIRYHQTLLDLAHAAVTDCPADERDINSLVLTLTQDEFEQIKTQIQDFSRRIYDEHPPGNVSDTSRVVQISMQIFPLTKASGGKK
ncbi:MAG: TIGR02147 family protein [Silvanigrellaceae bacterium]